MGFDFHPAVRHEGVKKTCLQPIELRFLEVFFTRRLCLQEGPSSSSAPGSSCSAGGRSAAVLRSYEYNVVGQSVRGNVTSYAVPPQLVDNSTI